MDISLEYVKMCEKAFEIQGLKRCRENADFFAYKATKNGRIERVCNLDCNGDHIFVFKHKIWLPRQDQLQEMVRINSLEDFLKIIRLNPTGNWEIDKKEFDTRYIDTGDYIWTKSFEQLWLAFVMKEKFNKRWNGEDWV